MKRLFVNGTEITDNIWLWAGACIEPDSGV